MPLHDRVEHLQSKVSISLQYLQIQRFDARFLALEDKLRHLESQNEKVYELNTNLRQDLLKSKEREQFLERIFYLIFNCVSQASGTNFLFGQQNHHLMLNQP